MKEIWNDQGSSYTVKNKTVIFMVKNGIPSVNAVQFKPSFQHMVSVGVLHTLPNCMP